MLTEKTVTQFLDELASNSPAPGGGSVAALAGAAGAALASMVCKLTIGKKKYADVQDEMTHVLQQTEELRKELTLLIEKDTEAFNTVMAAFGLPKGTDQEQTARSAAIQEATKSATLIPLQVMKVCDKAMTHALIVAQKGNKNSASDAAPFFKRMMIEKIIVVAPATAVPINTGFAEALKVFPAPSPSSRSSFPCTKSGSNPKSRLISSLMSGI